MCAAGVLGCWLAGAVGETSDPASAELKPAVTWTLSPEELSGWDDLTPRMRTFLEQGLALTRSHLTYRYGSADPALGGMDCSGFIHHVLTAMGAKDVPRSSSGQAAWFLERDLMVMVRETQGAVLNLDDLRPGDLLFWEGTYGIRRDPPVTHAMVYLGRRKSDGKPVMMGSSDGRTYDGRKGWGVSVFDFKPPGSAAGVAAQARTRGRFFGYGRIPPGTR